MAGSLSGCRILLTFAPMKTTAVIGASENPARYANMAVHKLRQYGHPVKAVGLRPGLIGDVQIETGFPDLGEIDTVTLYVGPAHQSAWTEYILGFNPRRIIFNPGTENAAFRQLAESKNILCEEACTLVMLSVGNY